ncbi:MAG TPA: hypothetical protein P5125_00485 [Kiritimatiellia bacterium]|nr:hypothetical protein [Kiritimatiellia bacterium]HRU18810.1 hypothetical protein [Kiritimatiellia bacterium]
MRQMTRMAAFVAMVLLAVRIGAMDPVSEVSAAAPLDTRSIFVERAAEDQTLNSRSFDVDWSEMRKLNTKKIVGTVMLMR